MSRNKLTLLSVAAAALLAAVLLGSVWFSYFTGKSADFTLPPPLPPQSSSGIAVSGPASGGLGYEPLTVSTGNIQTLLASVEPPTAFRQTIQYTTYWPGGEWTVTQHWARRGDLTRVETQQEGAPAQNRLTASGAVYHWTGDSMPYSADTVAPGEADAEALAGVPDWRYIMALPAESILLAEYICLPAERCLRVQTREAVYDGDYTVSLETGLLVSATFTQWDGTVAYRYTVSPPVLGNPGDEPFTLPDGQMP